jgi:hypothetical protein
MIIIGIGRDDARDCAGDDEAHETRVLRVEFGDGGFELLDLPIELRVA